MTEDQAAQEALARKKARTGLLAFTERTHPGWQSGEHHALICSKLEAVERGEIKRLMIFAPPRHSKSELASKRFPAWFLGRNPTKQIIACSYNQDLATDFGRSVRNLVRDASFRAVFPGVELQPDSTSAARWNTVQGGAYIAAGVGGAVTGRGAHCGIIDDPVKNREDADSDRIRENVWRWYASTFYTRLMPGGSIIMMLTRWHEDDLAARALASEAWEVVELPAISGEHTENERALWPQWYPLETLRHTRDVLTRGGRSREWSALYQQHPTSEQGTYILRKWFERRYEKRPQYLHIYMASDFAVTRADEGSDPDSTEHGVFGVDENDNVFVLDWWTGQTMADEWIDALLDLAAKHKPLAWFGESGVIRRAIEPFLAKRQRERGVYFRQEWIPSIRDKAIRGRSFQGRASAGRVLFPREPWAERIIEQCVGFPGSAHDDAFDVMSLMHLAIDQAHAAIAPKPKPEVKDRWRRIEAKQNLAQAGNWRIA